MSHTFNPDTPPPNVRRVITGHDSTGQPVIVRDEVVEPKFWAPGSINGVYDLYRVDDIPASNSELQEEWVDTIARSPPGPAGLISPNGATFRVFDYAPGASVFMPRTESLDFGIIMQGGVVLELDGNKSTTLKQGDVVIQRGTLHAWKNAYADQWTRIYWVVVGAKPVEVNGKLLGTDWSRRGG
ncbi:hypothetical protein BXZ70DRAFT_732471 [Cristinia sonorae]|uniref:Uncharacterized protein n=1 Tax=Cristinia sonorae TaxID=1940300 RepID=A0A8K0UT39_9AGAR|nr:hypothetical protein BXZ70DRAFT_732471 [Cristinia sonorae]